MVIDVLSFVSIFTSSTSTETSVGPQLTRQIIDPKIIRKGFFSKYFFNDIFPYTMLNYILVQFNLLNIN